MKFRKGDYFVMDDKEIYEIVSYAYFNGMYKDLAYDVRNIRDNSQIELPCMFVHGKGEKLELELMARILYQNLSPDDALDMHRLDKCPVELREILVRKMQEKLGRRG